MVGFIVGFFDGLDVGCCVGSIVGSREGSTVGSIVGIAVGSFVGSIVGFTVGAMVGSMVGLDDGIEVVSAMGSMVGSRVGFCVVYSHDVQVDGEAQNQFCPSLLFIVQLATPLVPQCNTGEVGEPSALQPSNPVSFDGGASSQIQLTLKCLNPSIE